MSTSLDWGRVGGVAVGTVAAFGLLAVVGTGATRSGVADAGAYLAAVRSLAHLLGIAASLALVYYAVRANRRYAGGVFGESATATAVGGAAFAVAFVVMELNHGLDIDVLAGVGDMQLKMAITMVLFTGTTFAFGWAFYRIAGALGGGRP